MICKITGNPPLTKSMQYGYPYSSLPSAVTVESAIRNSVSHHSAFAVTSVGLSPWKPQPGRSEMLLTVAAAYGEMEKKWSEKRRECEVKDKQDGEREKIK